MTDGGDVNRAGSYVSGGKREVGVRGRCPRFLNGRIPSGNSNAIYEGNVKGAVSPRGRCPRFLKRWMLGQFFYITFDYINDDEI